MMLELVPATNGVQGPRVTGFYPIANNRRMHMGKKSLHRLKAENFIEAYDQGNTFLDSCRIARVTPSESCGGTYYVYMLVRTDVDEIVYVGKGKDKRMLSHMREVRAGRISGVKKYLGLRELASQGVEVKAYCFIDNQTESVAYNLERLLIKSLRDHGLLNSSDGGMTRNEYALAQCKALMDKLPSKGSLAMLRGAEGERQENLRSFLVKCIEKHEKEIKVSEAIGYAHSDWWDDNRIVAHMSYLRDHPEMRSDPMPIPEYLGISAA